MNKDLRAPDYLGHIAQAVERIQRFTAGLDEAAFLGNELVQDAVLRNIEIIGEASNQIQRTAPELASAYPEIPWRVLYAMRNRISHAYEQVDLELVWKTVQNDLPHLQAQVRPLLANFLHQGTN